MIPSLPEHSKEELKKDLYRINKDTFANSEEYINQILDIADLTVDGSFALGGCVCATLVVAHGMNPVLALILATLAGMIAGAVTGFLHTAFDIPAIFIRYFDSDCPLVHQPSDYGEKQHSTVKDKNNFFRFC